jgi:hypothetical protein
VKGTRTKRFATLPTPVLKLFFNTASDATTLSSLDANALSWKELGWEGDIVSKGTGQERHSNMSVGIGGE